MSYIKLQDAKNAIINCITEQTVSKYATSAECRAARHGADIALFALDDIPIADVVEVRHGKWLPTKASSYFGGVIYECSLCNAHDGEYTSILGRYCWRCGAKMDVERREENEGIRIKTL